MADFRKLFYALGLAALLTGTASAQVQCQGSAATPPIIRAEGFTEQVGDYVLDCTGGTPTNQGEPLPPITVTITLSAPVTSALLSAIGDPSGPFNEALLIIDEPNSSAFATSVNPAGHGARPLLACGNAAAPYGSTPGVCGIIAPTDQSLTYDGTTAVAGDLGCDGVDPDGTFTVFSARPATNSSYGCGRPNVFQGRVSPNNPYQIYWAGVPFNAPGSISNNGTPHRILRITNVRVASPDVIATIGQLLTTITMEININGTQSFTISNRIVPVASVAKGILALQGFTAKTDFIQCVAADNVLIDPNGIAFEEGFPSSFKARNFAMIRANGTFSSGVYWKYNGTTVVASPLDRQNVPGAIYYTESGFMSPALTGYATPSPNPPQGVGPNPGGSTGGNAGFNGASNIDYAGIATNGTRVTLRLSNIPLGSVVNAPGIAYLYRAGDTSANPVNATGVAVKVSNANAAGAGLLTSGTVGSDGAVNTTTTQTGNVTYEVLFSDPNTTEDLRVPLRVSYSPNLSSDLPQVNTTAQATGGFAPYQGTGENFAVAAANPLTGLVTLAASNSIPRFRTQTGNQALFSINKCACNLLFPYVTSAGGYDTGIAIANTSKLPATTAFKDRSQQGNVTFYYFPKLSTDAVPPSQTTTRQVQAGETLQYVMSQPNTVGANAVWGLNAATQFTGYIVAQANFQYCHGFAFMTALGAGPTTGASLSVGYLALQLDNPSNLSGLALPNRTTSPGEALTH